SGLSMDHVRVHYNSSQPAQLNALAYAQGSDIHLAPGQERHLPHEAWHVVQQAQGRVRPTLQMKDGVQVNDDVGLEQEADEMGARAAVSVAQRKNDLDEKEMLQGKFAPVKQRADAKPNSASDDGQYRIKLSSDNKEFVYSNGAALGVQGILPRHHPVISYRTAADAQAEMGVSLAMTDGPETEEIPDHRGDKGATPALGLSVTESAGRQALATTTLGMTTPTHSTEIVSAEKVEDRLVVALSHKLNIDVSVPTSTPIDVGVAGGIKGIQKRNWQDIVDDLRPNDLGKAQRGKYWSAQLVDRHEQKHVADCKTASARGLERAQQTLNGMRISDEDFAKQDALALAEPFRAAVHTAIRNEDWKDYYGADYPVVPEHDRRPGEIRAYTDGKPHYEALVRDVEAHAERAGWAGQKQKAPRSVKTEKLNKTFLRDD
ncbi:MAG: DUF4157 domain-containing protein, partial [Cyanobacteriota bacterium]